MSSSSPHLLAEPLLLSMSSPRSILFKAQLTDKDVEIQQLKNQVVSMYSKMSFLETENDSLRKRVVSLEQLQLQLLQHKGVSASAEDSSSQSPENPHDRIVVLEGEVRQLREQNAQLKATLKSVLSAT